MRISEILNSTLVKTDLVSQDKYEAIEELISLLSRNGLIEDRQAASEAIREREEMMSTGIVPYVALPHGKIAGVHDVVLALGISKKGVDYDALDGKPVKIIFLVLSEEGNPGPHLRLLAEISRLISDEAFIDSLMDAPSPERVMQLIASQE